MKVRVPILTAVGYYEYEINAKTLDEARELLREGEAEFLNGELKETRLNFDAMKEIK